MNPDLDTIEQIIDRIGLTATLELIAQICYEKGDHVRSTWQDENLAKTWERDGEKIDKLTTKIQAS